MVAKYDSDLKEFKFNYQNIMIKQYGVDWVAQYGNRAEIEHVNIKMIQDGTDIHQRAEGRVKAHHREREINCEGDTEEIGQRPKSIGCGYSRPLLIINS